MGPRVDFYLLPATTTPDAFKYACRLAEKSYLSQQKTLIWTASKEEAESINVSLWTFRDISFVPHAIYSPHPARANSGGPVLIAFENAPSSGEVLINLTEEIPAFFTHFNRVIEIVSDQTDALAHSRKKYRLYREHDCELFSHNLKTPTV